MSRVGCLWCLVLVACGSGAARPAESPGDGPHTGDGTPYTPETSASSESSASESAAASAPKGSEESAASADELSAILQRVLEDEELDKYLHLTLPGRFPLKLSGGALPSGVSLTKGNQPVAIVDGPKSNKDAVLQLTTVEVSRSQATIGYRYDVEGIRGTARLKKGDRGWELTSSRIVEH